MWSPRFLWVLLALSMTSKETWLCFIRHERDLSDCGLLLCIRNSCTSLWTKPSCSWHLCQTVFIIGKNVDDITFEKPGNNARAGQSPSLTMIVEVSRQTTSQQPLQMPGLYPEPYTDAEAGSFASMNRVHCPAIWSSHGSCSCTTNNCLMQKEWTLQHLFLGHLGSLPSKLFVFG